jgi:hypothetical protein
VVVGVVIMMRPPVPYVNGSGVDLSGMWVDAQHPPPEP